MPVFYLMIIWFISVNSVSQWKLNPGPGDRDQASGASGWTEYTNLAARRRKSRNRGVVDCPPEGRTNAAIGCSIGHGGGVQLRRRTDTSLLWGNTRPGQQPVSRKETWVQEAAQERCIYMLKSLLDLTLHSFEQTCGNIQILFLPNKWNSKVVQLLTAHIQPYRSPQKKGKQTPVDL